MKLATLRTNQPDGSLILVSRDLRHAVSASDISPTLLSAVEQWSSVFPALQARYDALNNSQLEDSFSFQPEKLMAPLPRTWQWLDGSCFLNHGELMQTAFELEPIEGVEQIPLIYQGAGDDFAGPSDPVPGELAFQAATGRSKRPRQCLFHR